MGVDRVPAVKTPAELTELFRARGLKVTPQRQAIFHVLHGEQSHPTAESVYDAVTDFRGEVPAKDDMTVVALRITG